jgi:hypothetical protein
MRRGAERRGSACLDHDVATVWPSYALLPLLSFAKPHSLPLGGFSRFSVSLYSPLPSSLLLWFGTESRAVCARVRTGGCVPSREFVIYEESKSSNRDESVSVSKSSSPWSSLRLRHACEISRCRPRSFPGIVMPSYRKVATLVRDDRAVARTIVANVSSRDQTCHQRSSSGNAIARWREKYVARHRRLKI